MFSLEPVTIPSVANGNFCKYSPCLHNTDAQATIMSLKNIFVSYNLLFIFSFSCELSYKIIT